jgi:hypothetical protein
MRLVCFRKIKGHSGDEWNDLADRLAVKGRDQQAKEAVVQLVFRAVIAKGEKFFGIDRFSTPALANMDDFWPKLRGHCGDDLGSPEDYKIWHRSRKLEESMRDREQYEIIARQTPGFTVPSELRAQMRGSVSEERAAFRPPSLKHCEGTRVAPPIR